MVFSTANSISEKEKKAIINPEHVLAAIEQLEMDYLREPVAATLQGIKESKGRLPTLKSVVNNSSRTLLRKRSTPY